MDEHLFAARVTDTARICENTDVPKYLGFLSPSLAGEAELILKNKGIRYSFFGGYEEAQRTFLVCLPEWCEELCYPITALTFRYRRRDALSHRDFLGTFMSLGITRESVGDILVEDGRAVAFVSSDIAEYVKTQIAKVGGVGVEISYGFENPLPQHSEKREYTKTVASLRLDCVISAICDISRNAAAQAVETGLVTVNSRTPDKITRTVSSGDVISARGKGKFNIVSADTLSKKGRIILVYTKYV